MGAVDDKFLAGLTPCTMLASYCYLVVDCCPTPSPDGENVKINVAASHQSLVRTHEGGPTTNPLTPTQQLRRTLLTCMLWEDNFYESGVSVADRIKVLVAACDVSDVCRLAVEARTVHHLRHVPLLLLRELLRKKAGRVVGDTIAQVIQRPDEITELLALYWKDTPANGKRKMLSKQVRLGISRAFRKFDEYQLAKYDREGIVRLRDALFMSHAKPKTVGGYDSRAGRKLPMLPIPMASEHEQLYRKLVDGTLATPQTWEVALSAGKDKRETFEILLREGKLGYMALLRNLRNMEEANVPLDLICNALESGAAKSKALPFRYIAAYRAAKDSSIKASLNTAMLQAIKGFAGLPGRTLVLVDVSGSMDAKLSGKSDFTRMDAAAALAVYLQGICELSAIATFSNDVKGVPMGEPGIALVDRIIRNQSHGGTMLGLAVTRANQTAEGYDRIIVITDEQSHDEVPQPLIGSRAWIINVAPYRNGVGYEGGWNKIDGFSEQVINYIQAVEAMNE